MEEPTIDTPPTSNDISSNNNEKKEIETSLFYTVILTFIFLFVFLILIIFVVSIMSGYKKCK